MSQADQSRPLTGMFWMLFAGLCFVVMTALVKSMGPRMPAAEAAFIRYALGIVFLLPLVPQLRRVRLNPLLWGQYAARGSMHAIGVMLWFFAMTRIPIADITAMNYLSPIYVTLGAALFLGERLAFRRIAAIIAALLGAAIILRPGFREVSVGHWAMLLTALVFGGSYLLAKVTVDKAGPAMAVAMLSFWVTIVLAPFAWAVWIPPTWGEVGVLFAVAFFATLGHYAMSLALAAAPVTMTQPVTYLQLVWATLLGLIVFSEPVDIWVLVGGSVILASVTFITWREAVLNRQPITPPSPATKL